MENYQLKKKIIKILVDINYNNKNLLQAIINLKMVIKKKKIFDFKVYSHKFNKINKIIINLLKMNCHCQELIIIH